MKIAIVILIHEYKEQQKILIRNLAKDFDVFVHIDKRSKIKIEDLKMENVFPYKKYKVYWGHYNQILATLFLFQKANEKKYDRYIFISGADIPLKSNLQIKIFFENNEKEYFSFSEFPVSYWSNGGFDRIDYFHAKSLRRGKINIFDKLFCKIKNKINQKILTPLMKSLNLTRRIKGIKYFGGANWMDLTGKCVSQIIEYTNTHKKFVKKFRYTINADEIFFQTIICNFVKDIIKENITLRYIDWDAFSDSPRILRKEDYKKIKASKYLFARKFDSSIDPKIMDMLYKDIGFV